MTRRSESVRAFRSMKHVLRFSSNPPSPFHYSDGDDLLGVRRPARVEHMRRPVVRDDGAEEQAQAINCE